jgi:peroxiredoxin
VNQCFRVAAGLLLAALLSAGTARAQAANSSPTPAPVLAVGDKLPPFDAAALDGTTQHLDYKKGTATVLLFFLSGCPTCHKMIPEWNRAYERRPKGLEITGVLMDHEPPGFFMATPVSFPVLRAPGGDFSRTFKIYRVPMTVRIGPDGKVQDVGFGLLDPIRLGEILRP